MLGIMLMLSIPPLSPRLLISRLEERETAKSSAWKSNKVLFNSSPDYILRTFFYLVIDLSYINANYSKAYKTSAETHKKEKYDGGETAGSIVPEVGKNGIDTDSYGNKNKNYSHKTDYMQRQIAETNYILYGIFHQGSGGPFGTAGSTISNLIVDRCLLKTYPDPGR